MKSLSHLAILLPVFCMMSCGSSQSDGSNSSDFNPYPGFHSSDVPHAEKNFANLINKYQVGKNNPTPWAGYWWPYGENGIAAGKFGGSPAGKYDAARGGRTHAQDWEVKNHGSKVPKLQGWWGHCNGWCAASALFAEPRESKTVNGIEFGIADIKAILSEAGMEASADFFGQRVDWGNEYGTAKYYDTVPDQYFLVLTNYIGKLNIPVLIDRYTGDEIWNQPLAGYKIDYPTPADYLGADPAHPDIYRINVTSTIWWAEDGVQPDIQTPVFDFDMDSNVFTPRTLKMEVWLDGPVVFGDDGKIKSSGNVIVTRTEGETFAGGAWKMGDGYYNDVWPDYMWVPHSLSRPNHDDPYGNPEIDAQWVTEHIVKGVDDHSVSPIALPSEAPTSRPSAGSGDSPFPWPTTTHSAPNSGSTPGSSHTEPQPEPWPIPWPSHT